MTGTWTGHLTLSHKELGRLEVLQCAVDRRMLQAEAAKHLKVTQRHFRRLLQSYRLLGASGVVNKARGKPSNNKHTAGFRKLVLDLVRTEYQDFGPTFAAEKLQEIHKIRISKETLRKWMVEDELWVPRKLKERKAYQPRNRRACVGELIQIDGSDHEWFEERGPRCTLLVYIDDATSRLMEMHFVESESTLDYFVATKKYIERHGKPVAFYSDRATVFRVPKTTGKEVRTQTQFMRGLSTLNIDLICANSSQAKGRVERCNLTLQDRLVKEMRLRGISSIAEANAFAPEYMEMHNAKFAREPRSEVDAHRPVFSTDDLENTLCTQEERTLTKALTLHYKRQMYLVEPTKENRMLAGNRCKIFEWADGTVKISCRGRWLGFAPFDKNPVVANADIVDNKRLGAALRHIKTAQVERDEERLKSRRITLREKENIIKKHADGRDELK